MQKRICLLLTIVFILSSYAVSAKTFTPQPDMAQEIFIRTTLTDLDAASKTANLGRMQVMAALQVMTFPDKKLHPSIYMTEDEVLRVLYHVAGVRKQVEQLDEDEAYRKEIGLGDRDSSSHSDGLYFYAYQNGLISKSQFDGYFFTYALSRNSTALRYDVYLWMSKLFGIAPEANFDKLSRFSDGTRIKQEDKPYFAALVNRGLVMNQQKLELYAPVSREWFLNTLERMESYYIQKLGYEKKEGTIVQINLEENKRQILLKDAAGNQDMIEVPIAEDGNQLACDIAVLGKGGRQITASLTEGESIWYYLTGSNVAFMVVQSAMPKSLSNLEVKVDGTLYYYDQDLRMAVIQTKDGYLPVFLAENVSLTVGGGTVAAFDLHRYYDKKIKITAIMRNEHDLLTAKTCLISD